MKTPNKQKTAAFGGVLILALLAFAGLTTRKASAQTDDERQIREVLGEKHDGFRAKRFGDAR